MRRCILHVGYPRSGTPAISHLVGGNREAFGRHGILVPSRQGENGSHANLVRALAGVEVRPEHIDAQSGFEREIAETESDTVLISSELLFDFYMTPTRAEHLTARLKSFGLHPTILLYVQNQPQLFNAAYGQAVKACKYGQPFARYAHRWVEKPSRFDFSRWLQIEKTYGLDLIVRPRLTEMSGTALVEDFLRTLGVISIGDFKLSDARNESAGAFTVAVARELVKRIANGAVLTPAQAALCRKALHRLLSRLPQEETSYCGLSTQLARHIEEAFRPENDRVATTMWGRTWAEMFPADIGREFESNDYDVAGVPEAWRVAWQRALTELEATAGAIRARAGAFERAPRSRRKGQMSRQPALNGEPGALSHLPATTKKGPTSLRPALRNLAKTVGRAYGLEGVEYRTPLYAEEFPIVLMFCQKAGCTTLTKWFLYHTGKLDEALAYHPWIHRYRTQILVKQAGYKKGSLRLMRSLERPIVKLVRNPYDRAVSSFLHVVQNSKSPPGRPWAQQFIKEAKVRAGKPVSDEAALTSLSFLDFTRHVSAVGAKLEKVNGHVAQQFMEIERRIQPRIIKLEQFAEEARRIEDEFGLPNAPIERISSSTHHKRAEADPESSRGSAAAVEISRAAVNARQIPDYGAFYSEETRHLVGLSFAEDFDVYGYAT